MRWTPSNINTKKTTPQLVLVRPPKKLIQKKIKQQQGSETQKSTECDDKMNVADFCQRRRWPEDGRNTATFSGLLVISSSPVGFSSPSIWFSKLEKGICLDSSPVLYSWSFRRPQSAFKMSLLIHWFILASFCVKVWPQESDHLGLNFGFPIHKRQL